MRRGTRRVLPMLVGFLVVATGFPLASPALVMADTTPQTLPFSQAWTNIGLITTNDNWSGVPGINGYLGQDITTATGTDPQTLLSDSAVANDLDVIANQTNPSTLTNGGVAEFHVTDPTVGLNGSGTADAPHIVLTLNTTGASNVNVGYNLRDLDGSVDNSVQPVALQYRVGTSGSYTNVPAGFVADATTGPSLATLVTPVSVALPAAAGNQPTVQVRVITSNAVGNDEWVGVDDISITSVGSISLSINDVSANEADSGTTSFDFTVSLSAPAGPGGVTFDIATADNTATTAGSDYVANSLTGQTIPAASTTYLFSVLVNGDTSIESDETFFVNVTNVTNATVADGQGQGTITNDDVEACGDPATFVHTIQGSGTSSPLVGQVHTIEGVVVGDFQGAGSFGGYYVQEEDADADADTNTSEGIFVFNTSTAVNVGDRVRVRGSVLEFSSSGSLLTELTTVTSVLTCSTGNALPAPTTVTLPVSAVSDWERTEGMRISIAQTLTVTETFTLARFGEVLLSQGGRLFSPTNVTAPGAAAIALQADNDKRKILLDDGNNQQNIDPTIHPVGGLSAANTLRSGYTVPSLAGILDQRFGVYRVQPTGPVSFVASNPRTAAPDDVGGSLKVASFNVLNYFNGDGAGGGFPTARGANTLAEFQRQRAKEIAALTTMNADIIGLMELENDADPNSALADLVNGLNDATAPGTYAYIDTGVVGTDQIRVALIYKPGSVTPVGPYALLTTAVDPRFIDTLNRPALAQTFSQNSTGERLTVVVNHLKSKGSDCNAVGDPDTGDGQGNCNATRLAAAQALVDWLATDPTDSGDPDFLMMGDLNSYAQEDPIYAIKAGSDDTAGTGDDYTNLIAHFQGPNAYSYVFQGQSGYLDHALSSSTLTGQVTGVADWHINADEPIALDYNLEFKSVNQQTTFYSPDAYRSSDHDPVVIGLDLTPASAVGKVTGDGTYSGGKFALSAKFKKSIPVGNTTLTLNGGLTFVSTSYDWLVIDDNEATYQGDGKLNGTAGYGFLVSIVDGGTPGVGNDWIRIVIWETGGPVVFDQSGYLTKGNLTVHK